MNKDLWECDRCHKTVSGTEIQQIHYWDGMFNGDILAELCGDCYNDFRKKFMKMKVKEAKEK